MEGLNDINFFDNSVEKVAFSDYTFFNNGKELFTILAPTGLIPLEQFKTMFIEKFGIERDFGSEEGDSVSSVPLKEEVQEL